MKTLEKESTKHKRKIEYSGSEIKQSNKLFSNYSPFANEVFKIGLDVYRAFTFPQFTASYNINDYQKELKKLPPEEQQKTDLYTKDYFFCIYQRIIEAKSYIFEASHYYAKVAKIIENVNAKHEGIEYQETLLEMIEDDASELSTGIISFDFSSEGFGGDEDLNLIHKFTNKLIKCLEKFWALKHYIKLYLEYHDCDDYFDDIFVDWQYEYDLNALMYPDLVIKTTPEPMFIDIPNSYKLGDKFDKQYFQNLFTLYRTHTPFNPFSSEED